MSADFACEGEWPTGPLLDQDPLGAFSRNSRQSVLVDKRYFGILRAGKLDPLAASFLSSS